MRAADETTPWWQKPKGACHDEVVSLAHKIASEQSARDVCLQRYKELYEDKTQSLVVAQRRVAHNVIRQNIDTASAKLAKNKPRVQVLTSGGDFETQERAKKLQQLVDGQIAEMEAHREMRRVFKDAAIYGTGVLKIFVVGQMVRCERTLPNEILVDAQEGYYGAPVQLMQRRVANRRRLAAMYPKAKRAILDAPAARWLQVASRNSTAMVEVVEAWILPSKDDGSDGRHVICVDGATLLDEQWTKSWFPFLFFHWCEPNDGFWGSGIAEQLHGRQLEINRIAETIRIAHKRMGRPVIMLPKGANIGRNKITNEIAAVYEYDGLQPPTAFTWPVMSPETYQYLQSLIQGAFDETGVSQTAARGMKPAGVESGAAIREVNDIETERFVLVGQRYEEAFIDLTRRVIEIDRDLFEDGVDVAVKVRERKFLQSINWSDVDLDEDSFTIQLFSASLLPTQPAGRMQTVIDLASNGLIDPQTAKRLLDFPDVEDAMAMDLHTASHNAVRKALDSMKRGGRYIPPMPFMHLQSARVICQTEILNGLTNDLPEEAMEKLHAFLADCTQLMNPEPTAPPVPPPAAGGNLLTPALPHASMPALPDIDTMAATVPAFAGRPEQAMPGDAMRNAVAPPGAL